jgi:beta-lactamase class A
MLRKLFFILLTLLLISGVLLAPSYLRYRQTRGAVPPGVRVGGLEFGNEDEKAIAAALNRQFAEPVSVYYADQRILLRPQMLGYRVDVTAILADARARETPGHLLRVWVAQAVERPLPRVEVPLHYNLDREKLDGWLADLAARYDRVPIPPKALPASAMIAPGQPGRRLDLAASRDRIITALSDPHTRTANLVVHETAPPAADMKLLTELLQARMSRFDGIGGLFLQHIATGEELAINADVAYSGLGAMKLVILQEVLRRPETAPDPRTSILISQTVSLAGVNAANELLALIGDGDAATGVSALNRSVRKLGLQSTFMAAPFEQPGPRVSTPANSRTDITTQPDPYIQTTPREMGMVMQMLVECSRGGGTLLAAYREQITQAECQQLLAYLQLNTVTDLIVSGLPRGTQAVHRHGYSSDTEADVAAIWGPTGPYVLSIFLYRPSWLEWDVASETMGELSKMVWDYFVLMSGQ